MGSDDAVQIYRRRDGRWAWRRVSSNGDVIATDGGQGYEHELECAGMAEHCNSVPPGTYETFQSDPRGEQ